MNNQEQVDYWNGEIGQYWAKQDKIMARLLQPIAQALLDHAEFNDCRHVLDVGCGGGSQTRLLAERLGAGSKITGIDISEPLLEVARTNTSKSVVNMDYLLGDASEYEFPTAQFDGIFSRFGVMFFDDPIAAFTNLRTALTDGAKIAFSCWQGADKNDWASIPMQTAIKFITPPEDMMPAADAPGPFAFAQPEHVHKILHTAGFTDIELSPHLATMRMGEQPTLADSVREMTGIGPVQRLLAGQDEALKERVYQALEKSLADFYKNGAIELPGAIWFVTAIAQSRR